MMKKGIGHFEIERNKAIRVKLSRDFVEYYLWIIKRRFYSIEGAPFVNNDRYFTPRNGAHISVILPNFHQWNPEWNRLKLDGDVEFFYNPEEMRFGGSQKKGFSNFWLPVKSPAVDQLKDQLLGKFREKKNYLGLHITIANSKNDRKTII